MLRIITANAADIDDWRGSRLNWDEPMQRKCIVFVIDKPLCDDAWRRGQIAEVAEEDADEENHAAEATRGLNENVGARLPVPPPQVSLITSLANMMRGAFVRRANAPR